MASPVVGSGYAPQSLKASNCQLRKPGTYISAPPARKTSRGECLPALPISSRRCNFVRREFTRLMLVASAVNLISDSMPSSRAATESGWKSNTSIPAFRELLDSLPVHTAAGHHKVRPERHYPRQIRSAKIPDPFPVTRLRRKVAVFGNPHHLLTQAEIEERFRMRGNKRDYAHLNGRLLSTGVRHPNRTEHPATCQPVNCNQGNDQQQFGCLTGMLDIEGD